MAKQTTPPYWDTFDDALSFAVRSVGLSTTSVNAAMRITSSSQPSTADCQEVFEQTGAEIAQVLAMMEVSITLDTTTQAHAVVRAKVARLFGGRVLQLALAGQGVQIPENVAKLVDDELAWIAQMRDNEEARALERFSLLQLGATLVTTDPGLQRNTNRRAMVRSNWLDRTNTSTHTRPPEQVPEPTPLEPMYGGIGEQE